MDIDGPKRPAFQFKMERLNYSWVRGIPKIIEDEEYHICRECFGEIQKKCQSRNNEDKKL